MVLLLDRDASGCASAVGGDEQNGGRIGEISLKIDGRRGRAAESELVQVVGGAVAVDGERTANADIGEKLVGADAQFHIIDNARDVVARRVGKCVLAGEVLLERHSGGRDRKSTRLN